MADPVPQSLSSWHICNAIFLKSIRKKFNASRHILLITTFNWISTAMLVACGQAICLVIVIPEKPHTKSTQKEMWGWWVAWENSQHLAKLPLVSLPNDVWETSTEIPYWWRHYPNLGSASDGWIKFHMRLFSQARWRAGKERVALLSFPLRALPLTFMFSYTCSACYLKWKSWSPTTTSDTFFKQYFCMGLWVTFVCDATKKRYTAQTPSCVQLITSLTLDWQSKESYFKKMIQVL